MKKLIACLAVALCGGFAAAGAADLRGPLVAIPHCTVVSEGCGLDPETPDLNPAGCAATLARYMERRGVRTEVIGPGTVVCGEGSNALLLEGTLTGHCPARAENKLLLEQALSVRLELDLELKDCFSGQVLGRGRTKRAIEWGRHTLVRDALEELSHGTSERKIRRLFPETPIRWMKADVSGEHSFEVSGGVIDIEGSGINKFLEEVELDQEDRARRIILEMAYNPRPSHRTRVGVGLEHVSMEAEGRGRVDLDALNANPADFPGVDPNAPAAVDVKLQVVGLRVSLGHGLDFTKNQRVSIQGALGYYIMGPGFAPATARVQGAPEDLFKFRESTGMVEGNLRYEWRFTSHLAFSASYGYIFLDFHRPNRVGRGRHFAFDLDFSGTSTMVGLAGRF